ncbi:MAG: biotin/methionine sulfoxide reductase [Acidimicrobiia bacterium]|nr:biotin/methionine sulfoxide reductase [Acidimicrobiia bacterium]
MPVPLSLSHWGTYDIDVQDGRLVGVRALPGDPDPSPIGESLLDTPDHPVRIRKPAARKGWLSEVESGRRGRRGDRRRGGEPFVELSWETALDLAAAELDRVRREHGNEAIYAGSYGWGSAGRFHNPQTQLYRLLNLIGGFTAGANSYSYAAAEVILPYLLGDFRQMLGNHTAFEQLAAHGRLLVAFGGLPSKNQQVENGGTFRHLAPEGLRAMREAGVDIVAVSPLRSDVDGELDAEWWPIRPGTDVALMLALGHTLVVEGLADRPFLERYCYGAERFIAYLLGEDGGPARSAQWAAPICGVEEERILALARRMAAGPTLVTAAWALQRADHGEQAYSAVVALAALLGQIGTAGGGLGLGYGSVNRVGSAENAFTLARLPVGVNPVATFIPVARLTELLERSGLPEAALRRAAAPGDPGGPGETLAYDGSMIMLPDVRLVYWAGGNPFHHHQNLNRLIGAWQQPETVIVHEQAWNALARHADLVLPVTTTLERDDIGTSPLIGALIAMPRLIDPPGEARDDSAIRAGWAVRFGVAARYTEGLDTDGWLRRIWEESTVRGRATGVDLPPYEELWEKQVIELPRPKEPRVMLDGFRADPDANRLPTPSGRIELWSEQLATFDLEDCPAHAAWFEPVEWLGSPLAERFPLHLVSHQPAHRLHSQLDYGRASRSRKVADREPVRMHPHDAGERGIRSGDVVRLFNDRGATLAGAVVTDAVMPGVIVLATGAWYDPLEPGVAGSLDVHGNPNVLTSDRPASSLSQGPAPGSCLVQVERWEGEAPPVRCFEPPVLE